MLGRYTTLHQRYRLSILPVFSDSCLAFNRVVEEGKCDSILQSTEHFLLSSGLVEAQLLYDLLTGFNCKNASTYYYFERLDSLIDSERCTDLLTPQQTGIHITFSELISIQIQSSLIQISKCWSRLRNIIIHSVSSQHIGVCPGPLFPRRASVTLQPSTCTLHSFTQSEYNCLPTVAKRSGC